MSTETPEAEPYEMEPPGQPYPEEPEPEPPPVPTDPTVHLLDGESFRFDPADPEKDLTPKTVCGLVSDGSVLVSTVIERVACAECRPAEPEPEPVEEVAMPMHFGATAGVLSQPVPAEPVEVTPEGETIEQEEGEKQ